MFAGDLQVLGIEAGILQSTFWAAILGYFWPFRQLFFTMFDPKGSMIQGGHRQKRARSAVGRASEMLKTASEQWAQTERYSCDMKRIKDI